MGDREKDRGEEENDRDRETCQEHRRCRDKRHPDVAHAEEDLHHDAL